MKLQKPINHDYSSRGYGSGHRGIDYGWLNANPEYSKRIYAAAPGTIVYVRNDGSYNQGWGNRIIIAHEGNNATGYAHIRTGTMRVSVGQRVNAGDWIATMGTTGNSSGDHLHFELMLGGTTSDKRVDPAPYFSRDLPGTSSSTPQPSGNIIQYKVKSKTINERTQPNLKGEITRKFKEGDILDFSRIVDGEWVNQNGVNTNKWAQGAYAGRYFWMGNLEAVGSSTPSAPAKRAYAQLKTNWYYYDTRGEALQARNPKKWVPAGNHLIIEGTGPHLIYVGALRKNVWVGSSKTHAPVIYL